MRLFLLLALLILATVPQAGAQNASGLTIQIVPTEYFSRISPDASISFSYSNHFHVLLTNTSTVPITLFEEWNSWGYFALSFDITYPDGRTVRVQKKRRGWDKNAPTTVSIEPGGFYILNVTLNPQEWENSLLLEKSPENGTRCRMRAIYTIEPDEEATKEHAWTGRITSVERAYTIWH